MSLIWSFWLRLVSIGCKAMCMFHAYILREKLWVTWGSVQCLGISCKQKEILHFHFLFPSLCGLSTFKTLYSVPNTCHFLKSSKSPHVSAWIGHPQVLLIVF
jgi:hypothetical protein